MSADPTPEARTIVARFADRVILDFAREQADMIDPEYDALTVTSFKGNPDMVLTRIVSNAPQWKPEALDVLRAEALAWVDALTVESFAAYRATRDQRALRNAAHDMQAALADRVPSTTAHWAVQAVEDAVSALLREIRNVTTNDVKAAHAGAGRTTNPPPRAAAAALLDEIDAL